MPDTNALDDTSADHERFEVELVAQGQGAARLAVTDIVDIRNDMAIILGWSVMLEPHVDDDGAEYLQKVLSGREHVVELIETVRDYVDGGFEQRSHSQTIPIRSVLEIDFPLRKESFPEAESVCTGQSGDRGRVMSRPSPRR